MVPTAEILQFAAIPHYEGSYGGGFDFNWRARASGFAPLFQIQSQEAEGADWVDLLSAPVSTPYVAGVGPRQLSFQGDGHFRLLMLGPGGVVVTKSNPIDARFQLPRAEWLRYREMLRRERLEIEKLTGLPGWLLRRIIYGAVCPDCIDAITGAQTSSQCERCYGTGFDGGYYPAFPLWASWDRPPPGGNATTREDQGLSEVNKATIVTAPFPEARYEDVFVDRGTGQRYVVEKSDPVTFRSAPVKQKISLSRLPPSHPAYDAPAP